MQMAFVCHCLSAAALVQQPVFGPFKATDHMLQVDSYSCLAYSLQKEKQRKPFWHQINEKPSIILGCPGLAVCIGI